MVIASKRIIASASVLLAGCGAREGGLPQHPQAQCAQATFPASDRIAAWSVDKFAGRYTREGETLIVSREEHRLFVAGWVLGRRQLTAESVESWTWHDACGVRYEFTLPPDGPGAWLKVTLPDGRATDWHR